MSDARPTLETLLNACRDQLIHAPRSPEHPHQLMMPREHVSRALDWLAADLRALLAEKDARIAVLETSVDYLRDVCDHLPQPKVEASDDRTVVDPPCQDCGAVSRHLRGCPRMWQPPVAQTTEAEEPVSPRPPATSGRQVDFNINEFVRVKITDAGWRALWKADDTLNEHLKTTKASWRSQRTERLRDEQQRQGYTRWQLWSLMEAFGSAICHSCDVPFEPTITLLLPNWTEPPAAVQASPAPTPSREGPT